MRPPSSGGTTIPPLAGGHRMKTAHEKRSEALERTEYDWHSLVRFRPGWKPSPGAIRNVRNLRRKLGMPPSMFDTEAGE